MATYPLRTLLTSSAAVDQIDDVGHLLNASDTLRVLPLNPVYRVGIGDVVQRHTKLWNTLGWLFFEAETWDYHGSVFERTITPICRIEEAADFPIESSLVGDQLEYANMLRGRSQPEAQREQQSVRQTAHRSIELALSAWAARNRGNAGDFIQPTASALRALQISRGNGNSSPDNTASTTEIWVRYDDLLETALASSPDLPSGAQATPFRDKELLKESLTGEPGALTYSLIQKAAPRKRASKRFYLRESYYSDFHDQSIVWETALPEDPPTPEIYVPLRTITLLLEQQLTWSHITHRGVSGENAELETLFRSIHPSSDFYRVCQYLGKEQGIAWQDHVRTATKWNTQALVFTAALTERCNRIISRRLRLNRVKGVYLPVLYGGGLLLGSMLKNSWAFGWLPRSNKPVSIRHPFTPLSSKDALIGG